jgi:hypothetical protein
MILRVETEALGGGGGGRGRGARHFEPYMNWPGVEPVNPRSEFGK